MPPVYSMFEYIYPGPFMNKRGRLDYRTWFFIPLSSDPESKTATYLRFPAGADFDEFEEKVIDVSELYQWTD